MFIFTLAHCKFFNHFNIFFSKDAYVFLEAYGPSLPILSGISRITHSSPNLLNQEKISRIFNVLKYFFSSRNYSLFDSFYVSSFNFLWFRSLCLLSICITTILSSIVFIKLSTTTLSRKFDLVKYSWSIFYACTLLLLFQRSIVK